MRVNGYSDVMNSESLERLNKRRDLSDRCGRETVAEERRLVVGSAHKNPIGTNQTDLERRIFAAAAAGVSCLGAIEYRRGQLFGKVMENHFVQVFHGLKCEMPKVRPEIVPEGSLAAQFVPHRLKQRAAELLRLIDQEGQHHQHRKDDG